MIDLIVRTLFRWRKLRNALFDEVNMYNSLTRIINDPEAMKIAMTIWEDSDGWRGWKLNEDGTRYFNDIPEHSASAAMIELEDE